MTPDALRSELHRLGLTQAGAAKYLDVDERTVRRWATGDKPVPKAVALLLPRLKPRDVLPRNTPETTKSGVNKTGQSG